MISTSDRKTAVELIEEAHDAGARYHIACNELGITLRTLERWKNMGENCQDKRPYAKHPTPANALSAKERQAVLDACHSEEFSSLPPGQIVPILADRGTYLASESTFYRILREYGENTRRSRSKPPTKKEVVTHEVDGPNQVWTTDISWLPGPVKGLFFYLYFVLDLYSRKVVGYEVYEEESSKHLADIVARTSLSGGARAPRILHSDNGSPMKGVSLLELCYQLGIVNTYSRPRVSNDNAHIEAIFKTVKYCPSYPYGGFASLEEARQWVYSFVDGYNDYHRHSGIKYVTPESRHTGADHKILEKRHKLYLGAQQANPARWIRGITRNWNPITTVTMNGGRTRKQKMV